MNPIIEQVRETGRGGFLPSYGETCFRTLDGIDVARWLEAQGYDVASNRDTGRNGEAITTCGIVVSTNGYVHKKQG